MDLEDEVKSENMFSESDEILDGLDELEGDETSEQNLEEIGPEHIIDDPEQQEENQGSQSQQELEGEEDDNLEMLDMLCDGIEAEQRNDQRQELVKKMNNHMDEKLKQIRATKESKKM